MMMLCSKTKPVGSPRFKSDLSMTQYAVIFTDAS